MEQGNVKTNTMGGSRPTEVRIRILADWIVSRTYAANNVPPVLVLFHTLCLHLHLQVLFLGTSCVPWYTMCELPSQPGQDKAYGPDRQRGLQGLS